MAPGRRLISNRVFREDLLASSIELIGTTVFLFLAMGSIQSANLTVVATQGLEIAEKGPHSLERNIYISAAIGLSLLGSAWMFYRTTGGLFNPAITLALRLIGQLSTRRAIMYFIAQIAGAILASALLLALTPSPLLIRTTLGQGTSLVQGVFIEILTTAILVLCILMLAAEKSAVTPMAPVGIGMTLFACHLFSITFTGTSLNPARSFGPCVISGFTSDHWVYWVGPLLGSPLAVSFYTWMKYTKYWEINPNQSSTNPKDSPEDPVDDIKDHEKKAAGSNHRPIDDASDADKGHDTEGRRGDHVV